MFLFVVQFMIIKHINNHINNRNNAKRQPDIQSEYRY